MAVVRVEAALQQRSDTLATFVNALLGQTQPRGAVLDLSVLHELDAHAIDAVADALTVSGLNAVSYVVIATRSAVRAHFDEGGVFASVRVANDLAEAERLLAHGAGASATPRKA